MDYHEREALLYQTELTTPDRPANGTNRETRLVLDSLSSEPTEMGSTARRAHSTSRYTLEGLTEEQEYEWCYANGIQPADVVDVWVLLLVGGCYTESENTLLLFKRGMRLYCLKRRNDK